MEDLEVMVESGLSASQWHALAARKANVPCHAGTVTGQLSPPCSMGEVASGVLCPVPGPEFKRDVGRLERRDGEGPGAHDLQGEREGAGLG